METLQIKFTKNGLDGALEDSYVHPVVARTALRSALKKLDGSLKEQIVTEPPPTEDRFYLMVWNRLKELQTILGKESDDEDNDKVDFGFMKSKIKHLITEAQK